MVRRKKVTALPAPKAVAPEPEPVMKPTGRRAKHRHPCGFCSVVAKATPRHYLCPGTIKNAAPMRKDRVWCCPCWEANPEGHDKARDYRDLT